MTTDQFDKLYKKMDERFDSMHDQFDELRDDVRGIYNHLDEIRGLLSL